MSENETWDEYARYKYVVDNIKDVIWEVDTNAIFTFVSPTIKAMAGYDATQLIGRSILEFLTEDSRKFLAGQLSKAQSVVTDNTDMSSLYDVEFACADGRAIWCECNVKPIFKDNRLICYVGTSRDISEKKMYEKKLQEMLDRQKYINEQLEDMVTFDMLTGAYNRRKFEYYITREIEKTDRYADAFAIGIFDIDNFKQVNDVSGHNKGDRVLQDITTLVKRTLRATDKLFRWGGDEFIILFSDVDIKNAITVANKIREAIGSFEFDIEGKKVSVSFGVGAYTSNETPDQFIARVDKALLRAKNNGRNLVEQG